MTGCHVTLLDTRIYRGRYGAKAAKCGRPVVAHGLCEQHLADRVRLGGTP